MSKAKVIFHECIQNDQELCVPDEMMVSRVYFTLEVGDKKYEGLSAKPKHTVDSDYKLDFIEIGPLKGYNGFPKNTKRIEIWALFSLREYLVFYIQ